MDSKADKAIEVLQLNQTVHGSSIRLIKTLTKGSLSVQVFHIIGHEVDNFNDLPLESLNKHSKLVERSSNLP